MRNVLLEMILFALFAAELCFRFLPKILHEILGVAMLVLIIFHVMINRRRFVSVLKKMTPQKIFSLIVNIAMTICMGVILATGVCMSNYLFFNLASFELRRNITIHQLHVALPYVLMILIGVHIGLNWRELWHRVLYLFGAEEFYQRWKNVFVATAITLSAVGIAGFYLNQVGYRILMKHIFATPATDLPVALFVLLIVGGVAFFTLITFLVVKKVFKH